MGDTPRSMRLCYHAALCPILHAPFREPVVAEDGHTYERSAMEAWIRQSSKRGRGATALSPLTGAPLRARTLRPNHALRNLLAEVASGEPTVALDSEPEPAAEPAVGAGALIFFLVGAATGPLLSFATSPAVVVTLSRLLMTAGIAFVLAGVYLTIVPPSTSRNHAKAEYPFNG